MPDLEWHVFDYSDKATTEPPSELTHELVWITETLREEGVTLGYYDGYTFRTWNGSDDCRVTRWAEITYPDPPEGWDDLEDDEDDDESADG